MSEPDEKRLLSFLKKYSFLFDSPNNEFFLKKLYERIDPEWVHFLSKLNYLSLNSILTDVSTHMDCPLSLNHFFADALTLNCLGECEESIGNATGALAIKKIKAKKFHELCNFYHILQNYYIKLHINRVVDIGCGLGHLLNFICEQNSETSSAIKCVGIEADQSLCCAASNRYGSHTIANLRFSPNSSSSRRVICGEPGLRSAILSLHGCGDLQASILREFVYLQKENSVQVPLLMTIGCCYHKIQNFDEWPLSLRLKKVFEQEEFRDFRLPVSAFRVACQERMSRWECFTESEHEKHKQEFINRCLAECVYKDLLIEKGIVRKRGQNRNLGSSMDEFCVQLMQKNGILSFEEQLRWKNSVEKNFKYHEHIFNFVEGFTALQFAMQGPLESLILWDRVWFLKENGLNAKLLPIFNSRISPRNMCIIAEK